MDHKEQEDNKEQYDGADIEYDSEPGSPRVPGVNGGDRVSQKGEAGGQDLGDLVDIGLDGVARHLEGPLHGHSIRVGKCLDGDGIVHGRGGLAEIERLLIKNNLKGRLEFKDTIEIGGGGGTDRRWEMQIHVGDGGGVIGKIGDCGEFLCVGADGKD